MNTVFRQNSLCLFIEYCIGSCVFSHVKANSCVVSSSILTVSASHSFQLCVECDFLLAFAVRCLALSHKLIIICVVIWKCTIWFSRFRNLSLFVVNTQIKRKSNRKYRCSWQNVSEMLSKIWEIFSWKWNLGFWYFYSLVLFEIIQMPSINSSTAHVSQWNKTNKKKGKVAQTTLSS